MKRDNRGVTLVEIIVSLMVLMIIIVPLLSAFSSAMQSNRKAKANTYAKTVGEGVMEAVKKIGLEKTAKEFYLINNPADPNNQTFMLTPNFTRYEEVVPAGYNPSIIEVDGSKVFKQRNTGEYEYRIHGVKEGINTYDVSLKISSVAYRSDPSDPKKLPNDYQYADLSPFASKGSVVINPVLETGNYDDSAFAYFKAMHEQYKTDIYNRDNEVIINERTRLLTQFRDAHKAWEDGGKHGAEPTEPPLPPLPSKEPNLNDDQLQALISKKMEVTIKKDTDPNSSLPYIVDCKLVYVANNNGSSDLTLPNYNDTRPFAADEHTLYHNCMGFCNNKRFESIKSLVLLYSCFDANNNLSNELINIKDETAEKIDVYIMCQCDDVSIYGDTNSIKVKVDKAEQDKIAIHSNVNLSVEPESITSDKEFMKDGNNNEALYNITVDVYKGDGKFTDKMTSLKSSFVNE